MSASSRPTLAPDSRSDAARFTATVDLPTPPLPEPTAMTCLTPGIAGSWRPLKAAGTFAVIFTSTAVTPGRSETSWRASVWKRSRTGHAGVVSSNVKLTRPSSPMARSLIIPRLTTSRPRSGSLIAERTSRTSSLLGTEDHRRAQGQDGDQDQHRDDGCFHRHGAGGCLTGIGHRPGTTEAEKRRQDPDHGHDPEGEPGQDAAGLAGQCHGDQKGDQENGFEDGEVAVRHAKAGEAERRLRAVTDQKRDHSRRAAQARGEEEAAQRPRVAPYGLVAHAQEHAGVGGDEQSEHCAHDVEHAVEDHRDDPDPGVEGGDKGEETEESKRPRPDR